MKGYDKAKNTKKQNRKIKSLYQFISPSVIMRFFDGCNIPHVNTHLLMAIVQVMWYIQLIFLFRFILQLLCFIS